MPDMMNREIMEQLFKQYYGRMVRLARTLLRDESEADDVVQNVFARLLELNPNVADDKIEAYLMSSVRYGCYKRIKEMELRDRAGSLQRLDELENGDDDDLAVDMEQIHEFVKGQLPESRRSVFTLRIDEGLTFKEIAERLDMNINTVYKYFIQSIDQIKTQFITEKRS